MKNPSISYHWNLSAHRILIILIIGTFIGMNGTATDISKFTDLITINGHAAGGPNWNPESTKIITTAGNDTINVWNVTTGAIQQTFIRPHHSILTCAAWNPNGSEIASNWKGNVLVLDANTGTTLKNISGGTYPVTSVTWSPNGTEIASGSDDYTIKIWDVANEQNLKTVRAYFNGIWLSPPVWNPNGTKIASGSGDNKVEIWDAITGTNIYPIKNFTGHSGQVNSVAWSPDGTKIASGSGDSTIKIWDVATSKNLMNLTGHTASVRSVSWSPNGSYIASGSIDNTIKIWDVATGKTLKTLIGHGNEIGYEIISVVWSPDGNKIASKSDDGTIQIWGVGVPNVYVSNISVDKSKITAGENLTINATIANNGTGDANNIEVRFYDGLSLLGTKIVNVIRGGINNTTYRWVTTLHIAPGTHILRAKVGMSEKTIMVTISGVPNIYITKMTVDKLNIKQGEIITITGTIVNNGTADASNVKVLFYDGATLLITRYANISINKTNSTNYLWQTSNFTSIGEHNLKVIAGTSWKNVTVKVNGKPNIYLKDMTVDKSIVTIGEKVTINISIVNNGTADDSNVIINIFDGSVLLTTTNLTIVQGTLNTIKQIWMTSNTTLLGSHKIRAILGTMEKNITVMVLGKPNIYLKNLIVDRSNIYVGEIVKITATVGNNGTADAMNINMIYYDGTTQIALNTFNISKGGLNNSTVNWRAVGLTSIGSHTIRVIVGSNEKSTIIIVDGRSNVYVKNITIDKANINVGDKIIITVAIANNGSANASNIEVQFYDGSDLIGIENITVSLNETKIISYNWNTNNVKTGGHIIKAIVGQSTKETTVKIKSRPLVTIVENGLLIWIIILILFVTASIILIRGIRKTKNN